MALTVRKVAKKAERSMHQLDPVGIRWLSDRFLDTSGSYAAPGTDDVSPELDPHCGS